MKQSLKSQSPLPQVQLAAGGLVWRKINRVWKLAVIHRPKYGDWTLAKGKPEGDESLAETAQREIFEELGCQVRFLDFAGVTYYALSDGRVKVVLFWNTSPKTDFEFRPNSEVDQVLWLTPKEAARKLTHLPEQELVSRIVK